MKVDFMRWVDYWIGVPLCFLISLIAPITRIFKKTGKPKKVLFIELSEMGSTVLAYSAMKKAKELFNAELFFMIFKENVQSIEMLDIIPKKNIITIRSKSLFLLALDTLSAIFKMRSARIDTVIDLELFSRFTSILCYMSGAKNIVGFYKYHMEGLYRGNFQTHKIEYNPHIHISQSFMALVHSLTADLKDKPLLKKNIPRSEIYRAKIKSSSEKKQAMLKKLKEFNSAITEKSKIILINPNASQLLPIRKWPLKNFTKLAENILKQKDTFIVVTGVASEKGDANAIVDHVQTDRCIDFTGKTTLPELIDLFNISKAIITNDSGPAHFASLSDIKIVVLFGPETPKLYAPLSENCVCVYADLACSPCVSAFNHRKTPCNNSVCMAKISVDDVYSTIKDILK